MKIKLYSDAHLDAAHKLFPGKVKDSTWLERQWEDDEINTCKALETRNFIRHPCVDNYLYPLLDHHVTQGVPADILFVDNYLHGHPECRTLLSVGCGGGV